MLETESRDIQWGRAGANALTIVLAVVVWQVVAVVLFPGAPTEAEFYEQMSAGEDQALNRYLAGMLLSAGGSLVVVFTGLVIVAARRHTYRIRQTALVAVLVPLPLQALLIVFGGPVVADPLILVFLLFVSTFFVILGTIAGLVSYFFTGRPIQA